MMVTGANITCVMDNLEKEGFIKRIHSKEDRRVINAELTVNGRAKVDSIMPQCLENLDTLIAALNDHEQ